MLLSKDVGCGGGSRSATITGDSNGSESLDTATTADSIPVHPHGVKPLGNQYFASGSTAREYLGPMARLPDEMILHMLEYLDTDSLRDIGFTCRFLYAFSQLDDLWKTLFLESQDASTETPPWRGSWRSTHLKIPSGQQATIDCSNVYSDVVHRPFVCAHIALEKYATSIPKRNEISRLDSLTYDDFAQDWSNTPFILTRCIQTWPVCRDWSIQELGRKYSDVRFRAEAVDWPFSTYQDYMSNSDDESPLYLFDRGFAEKMDVAVGRSEGSVYSPPECFGPDLFEILHSERPAHRWLIVGPKRSGSTFHKDPNATSAWNAVIQGSKYWIMFPPTAQVPGVYVSKDSSEVTSPLSIAEWLLEFHADARSMPGCIEGVCKAGEILHVPSGWWHLVVNLEAGIALTQNFVPKSHLANVLSFLKDKPDQVTGFKRSIECPYDLFVERLRDNYPELLDEALEEMDRKNRTKKRKWEEAIGSKSQAENGGDGGGFSFGFGFADEDGEIP
ncbi:F-box domain-containing protein [Biscogniauxia mediterranea]|nr:F-box domain-containing protein [Biscogniauxia mediterranea]